MILGILASSGAGGGATAYESIATAIGTGSSGTIQFTSIPSTFTHLQIRGIGRKSDAVSIDDFSITLNNIATSSYAYHLLQGDGASTLAGGVVSQTAIAIYKAATGTSAAANSLGVSIIDILDYTSTSKNKTVRVFSGTDLNGSGNIDVSSGLFINTAAITSIELKTYSGNWTTATTFALYGIKAAA